MMGKFAAVLGPLLMGTTALLTGNARLALLSVAVLFAGGAIMLVIAARAARKLTPATGSLETSAG
jgi:UMF1 family MFS transporter